ARARATRSCDLPFWRGTETPTRLAAHVWSERSPIAASRMTSCQPSRVRPKAAERSATSSHELARAPRGLTKTRGGASPSSATGCDLVKSVTGLRVVSRERVDLGEGGAVLRGERSPLVGGGFVERGAQDVAEGFEGFEARRGHRAPPSGPDGLCV